MPKKHKFISLTFKRELLIHYKKNYVSHGVEAIIYTESTEKIMKARLVGPEHPSPTLSL